MTKVDELTQILANDFTATTYGASQNFREALEAALAEPEQEPVAYLDDEGLIIELEGVLLAPGTNLYTRPATPLSDEQIGMLTAMPEFASYETPMLADFARAVERLHGIGVKK